MHSPGDRSAFNIDQPLMTQGHAAYSNTAALEEAEVYLVTAHAPFNPEEVSINRAIGELLSAVRELLQLDVVFIGEIVDGRRVFRQLDTVLTHCPIDVGGSHPMHQTVCQRILDGRLPALIPNVLAIASTQGLPDEYNALGTHIGVPVHLPDGRLYGMLCGFNIGGACALTARDVSRLEIAARSAAHLIARAEGSIGHACDPALV